MKTGAWTRVALISIILLMSAVPAFPAGQEPPLPTALDLIREGVRLHDEGKFEDAIQRYKKALEIEPENSLAMYELAWTYAATKQLDLCLEVARKGLKNPGKTEAELFTIAGSCLSSAGKTGEAIRTFEQGLAKYPENGRLNFNIAVTLLHDNKPKQAVARFEKAIEANPAYSSPYLAIGRISADEGSAVPALFYHMRFVSLEPDSERSGPASAAVFEMLTYGVKEEGQEKKITIQFGGDPNKTAGDMAVLELSRTLAAATIHLEEAQKQSEAQRYVAALGSFVEMAEEQSQGDRGGQIAKTFMWKRAAAPMVQL